MTKSKLDSVLETVDILLEPDGTVTKIFAKSNLAKEWMEENVAYDAYQIMGDAIVGDSRMVAEMADGAERAGLVVAWAPYIRYLAEYLDGKEAKDEGKI